jgi:hypothetical protein
MLTSIKNMFVIFSIVSTSLMIITAFIYLLMGDDCERKEKKTDYFQQAAKFFKLSIVSFLILVPLTFLIPNTKQAVAIWLTPKIVNNEQVQEVPQKGLDILTEHMKQYLEELEQRQLNEDS